MLDTYLIGKRIKELRKERGLTQGAFADELHVSFQAVSNWERGIAPPELENLLRIAEYFGVLVDDLLRPSSERVLLGIDGGGTKTEFVIATQSGQVLARFTRGGSNPNDIGLARSVALIGDGIRDALRDFPSIASVFCGIAGASTGDNAKKMHEQLCERFPKLALQVETDSANLFAIDDDADMAVISGTGSVVFVRRGKDYIRLGGWGYLLDTGGSAYDLGRDAVRVALSEEDSREEPSYMSQLLRQRLECQSVWSAVSKLYAGGKPYIASLAEVVFLAYAEGDKKAMAVVEQNVERLAGLLNIGAEKYGARMRAVAGGGIFEHHREVMLKTLSKYTETDIVIAEVPQVYGACRRAFEPLNIAIPEEFYENFKLTYGGKK